MQCEFLYIPTSVWWETLQVQQKKKKELLEKKSFSHKFPVRYPTLCAGAHPQ